MLCEFSSNLTLQRIRKSRDERTVRYDKNRSVQVSGTGTRVINHRDSKDRFLKRFKSLHKSTHHYSSFAIGPASIPRIKVIDSTVL